MKKYNVAVVGATGAVGKEMLSTLESRKFPVNTIKLLASSRSAGDILEYLQKTPLRVLILLFFPLAALLVRSLHL